MWSNLLSLSLLLQLAVITVGKELWPESIVTFRRGHYPHYYCILSNAVLNATDGVIHARVKGGTASLDPCHGQLIDVWQYSHDENLANVDCDQTFDEGHLFTIFYWYGKSNNYHLTKDMLIPLFQEVYYQKEDVDMKNTVFLPTVEKKRLESIAWNTDAFKKDANSYWNRMIELIASNGKILPMDMDLRNSNKNICIKTLKVGTTKSSNEDPELMKAFVQFIKDGLHVEQDAWRRKDKPRVAFISRSNRRLVTNEAELVEALNAVAPTDLITFDDMTFKEQVEIMSHYTVLAGINGAGLMNGIYLPPHGVIIQMVPYQSKLNVKQYGAMLAARGPYMEWWNEHEDKHFRVPNDDYDNRPNTEVTLSEMQEAVKHALYLAEEELKNSPPKEEL